MKTPIASRNDSFIIGEFDVGSVRKMFNKLQEGLQDEEEKELEFPC